jgi:hypothetical protein
LFNRPISRIALAPEFGDVHPRANRRALPRKSTSLTGFNGKLKTVAIAAFLGDSAF